MLTGIAIGLVIGLVIHFSLTASYKRILVMKSKDNTAEHINGKFYYVMSESDYNKYTYLKDAGY